MIKRFFLDKTQGALQQAKLDRIKEFAEGVICRRKILLNYFGEEYSDDCGNCDVCEQPFTTLNGTEISQHILNTVLQMSSQGSCQTKELVSALTQLSDKVSFASWHFYVAQLKNQGLITIDFSEQTLQLSEKGTATLADKLPVRLVLLDTFIERQQSGESSDLKPLSKRGKKSKKRKSAEYDNPLFEKLRHKRLVLAQENSIAAYMIFSDTTLLELAQKQPKTKAQMLEISGIGEVKWQRYGKDFLQVLTAEA